MLKLFSSTKNRGIFIRFSLHWTICISWRCAPQRDGDTGRWPWNRSTMDLQKGPQSPAPGRKDTINMGNNHIIIMIINGVNHLKMVNEQGADWKPFSPDIHPTLPCLSYSKIAACSNLLPSWSSPFLSPCNTNMNPHALAISTGINCISTGNGILSHWST